jgi:hypothetical protein
MAIVVTRTEAGLSATTSFQSMNNQFASSGLSLVVPSGVSQISSIDMGVSSVATGADFCSGFKLTGTALQEGDATFMGPAVAQAASSGTGVANCVVQTKTALSVTPGNTIDIQVAVTTAATIDASCTIQFE